MGGKKVKWKRSKGSKNIVLQGTVRCPVLCFLYINVISQTTVKVCLFVDDCLIYRYIDNVEVVDNLQQNLAKLSDCVLKWEMIMEV